MTCHLAKTTYCVCELQVMESTGYRDRFPQLFAGLTLLSASLIVSSFLWAGAIRNMKRVDDALLITGSAKRPIKSDYIVWKVSLFSQQPTTQAAYQELKARIDRVQRYLKDAKVPESEISLESLETVALAELINGKETGKTAAYKLSQKLEIRSNQVDRYSKLSQQITELINEGIPLTSEPPEYLYNDLSKLRIEMVAEATKDAKARAESIAKSTGNRVGGVRSADTGVFQITPRYSTGVSGEGRYDTTSIDKDITAVVSVKFGIE
nr:SIMPL domain-containing protein [Chamaesiphon sp. GL140_3_metabinner_50]